MELNPRSERCPNCGTSARLAKPDGDTLSRVRRQIAVVNRVTEPPTEDFTDTSFSPVMKFDRPEEETPQKEPNPSDNFIDYDFTPVDLNQLIADSQKTPEELREERRHKDLSAQIREMIHNKEDDLLAEYYFDDGISDLERFQLAQGFAKVEREGGIDVTIVEHSTDSEKIVENSIEQEPAASENQVSVTGNPPAASAVNPVEEEMSEAARRLNTFPEESGLDKILTIIGEGYDNLSLKIKAFFHKLIFVRIKKLYDRFDKKTAPFLNKLLDQYYYIKFKGLKRKQEEVPEDKKRARRFIWSGCLALLIIAVCVGIFVASLFSAGVTGEWIVSYDTGGKPNVIMEFTPTGKAVVSVKSEDGWHVHMQGSYKTQRKNGHDLLTITYDDGTMSRLYYVIDGKEGTFINVETNVEVVYDLK